MGIWRLIFEVTYSDHRSINKTPIFHDGLWEDYKHNNYSTCQINLSMKSYFGYYFWYIKCIQDDTIAWQKQSKIYYFFSIPDF